MSTKERAQSHLNEEKSRALFKQALPTEWVFRDYSPDYGIDLSIELFSETNGKYYTQGEHIYIQLKSIEKPIVKKMQISARYNIEKLPIAEIPTNNESCEIEVIKYQIETSLLETVEKMGSAVPILLILVNVKTQDIFYVCLNDYIEKVIIPVKPQYFQQKTMILNIPTKNIIDKSTGKSIIEWYAKRPKLFAFFNKVAYQYHELQYSNGNMKLINHFATIIARLDAWSAAKYFPALNDVKTDFFYFLEHKRPIKLDSILLQLKIMGYDIDSEEWENSINSNSVSLTTSMEIQQICEIWRRMDNVGRIFEDIIKEADLPTYIGQQIVI